MQKGSTKTKLHIKIQLLPHREYSTTIIKTNQFIPLRENTAVCVFRHRERDAKSEENATLKLHKSETAVFSPVTCKTASHFTAAVEAGKLAAMQPHAGLSHLTKGCGTGVQTKLLCFR